METQGEHPSVEDVKEQMQQALARKHRAEHPGEPHLDSHGKAEQTHGPAGGPERFQRKSG